MLKSMTGFGKATGEYNETKIAVEIKSLNSKQGDINLRIPTQFKEKEIILRKELLNKLYRGKIDITINIENHSQVGIKLNQKLIKQYFEQLSDAASSINQSLEKEQVMQMILRMPDVVCTEEAEYDEKEWQVIENTVWQAVEKLNDYRQNEGLSLQKDIINRVNKIADLLGTVQPYEEERTKKVRERIEQNLNEFVTSADIDRNRFEQEIIFYLEKYDITEEKVRLRKHCSYFIETVDNEDITGKKLGFISQEMGREINTLGSKANNVNIQKVVIQMKEELEKIKEQLLNIL